VVRDLLRQVGIRVGGEASHDIQVHDPRFFSRVLRSGSLGLGESYVAGWWDSPAVDGVIHRILAGGLGDRARRDLRAVTLALKARLLNLQRPLRASRHVLAHYERDAELFRAMLDRRMVYSCAYWRDAQDLDEAQEAKLEMICRKLRLRPGQTLLDIGCGWGALVRFAAERYGVQATGITLSPEQAAVAREECRGLPVEIRVQDYRDVTGRYDAVASVGMFEHVGARNHRTYMQTVARVLAADGISLLHTIAGNAETRHIDPWIHRYVFPGAQLPTMGQIGKAAEDLFVVEHVENIGPDYDQTLTAWHRNFEVAWPRLAHRYDDSFRRMWRYYLLTCAGTFRARWTQVLQVVLTRPPALATTSSGG
jgi:cyclopropane-fatty-acyl-phospholipid synthase